MQRFNAIAYIAIILLSCFTVQSGLAQTCVVPPAGIIAWWPFDETNGTATDDIVGNHVGEYVNEPMPEAGKVRGALRFDGSNDYVRVEDSDLWAFGPSDFSIELWANFDTQGGGSVGQPGDVFIGNDEGSGGRLKWFFALGGGVLNFHINGSGIGALFFPRAPFRPNVGQWYHLAVTRNSDTYTLFIDGTPVASATDTHVIPNANAPLTIGQAEGFYTDGLLDEVTVYERALTEEEIRAIYNADSAGKCKNVIDVTPNDTPVAGRSLGLNVTLPDNYQPDAGQFFYRHTGQVAYQPITLTQISSVFTITIPAQAVTPRGIDYHIRFGSGSDARTYPATDPETNPARLRVRIEHHTADVSLPHLSYRMISVPLVLDDTRIPSVLEDDYSPYDSTHWRLFRWNPVVSVYEEPPTLTTSFTPGTAFWLNTRFGQRFDVDNGTSVDASRSYTLSLRPGWNQIATPFAFPVAWSSVSGNEQVEAPVAYDGVEYRYGQTVLEPWQGYFVFNPTSGSVTLSFPPVEAAEAASKGASSPAIVAEASYVVQLSATVPGYGLRDSENYLGFNEQASEGRDRLDFADPPGIGSYLRLSLIEAGAPLAGSFKPVGGEGRQWEVELAVVIEGEVLPTRKEVRVVLEEHGERPAGFAVYVLDKDFGRSVEVVEGVFSVEVSPSHPVRHLQVIVGTKSYAESEGGEIPLAPLTDALLQNFPNPFNPETQIGYQLSQRSHVVLEIFNLLGQRVRVLVQGEQDAGRHEVAWDGQDDGGVPVATGVYLYQLEMGGFRATRRMLLLR